MCIIAAKPAGAPIKWDWLKNCFENNEDGAGYAVSTGATVRVRKGLMDWETFHAAVVTDPAVETRPTVFHFRFATHGAVCPENTHPFPLSASKVALRALEYTAPLTLAHNGIIPGVSARDAQLSDTQQAIRMVLAPLGTATLQRRSVQALVGMLGKFALSNAQGWRVLGSGWTTDKGWAFSNTDYKTVRPIYSWSQHTQYSTPSAPAPYRYCILCDLPPLDMDTWDLDTHYGFCEPCFAKFYLGENPPQRPAPNVRAIMPASYSRQGLHGGGTTKRQRGHGSPPASYPAEY